MTLLTGHAAAETHRRLSRAVVALRAFSRRRVGRPVAAAAAAAASSDGDPTQAAGDGVPVGPGQPDLPSAPPSAPTQTDATSAGIGSASVDVASATPAPEVATAASAAQTPAPAPAAAVATGERDAPAPPPRARPSLSVDLTPALASSMLPAAESSGAGGEGFGRSLLMASQAPLLASSPLNRPLSTDDSGSDSDPLSEGVDVPDGADADADGGGGGGGGGGGSDFSSSGSSGGNPMLEAWAAAEAEAEAAAAHARAAMAAAEAAAKSAAASASVAAEGAALVEENNLDEALREVRGALVAGKEDGAEVERVAAGVGLAPALLGALRALKRMREDGGGSEGGLRLAKEVSNCVLGFGRT